MAAGSGSPLARMIHRKAIEAWPLRSEGNTRIFSANGAPLLATTRLVLRMSKSAVKSKSVMGGDVSRGRRGFAKKRQWQTKLSTTMSGAFRQKGRLAGKERRQISDLRPERRCTRLTQMIHRKPIEARPLRSEDNTPVPSIGTFRPCAFAPPCPLLNRHPVMASLGSLNNPG